MKVPPAKKHTYFLCRVALKLSICTQIRISMRSQAAWKYELDCKNLEAQGESQTIWIISKKAMPFRDNIQETNLEHLSKINGSLSVWRRTSLQNGLLLLIPKSRDALSADSWKYMPGPKTTQPALHWLYPPMAPDLPNLLHCSLELQRPAPLQCIGIFYSSWRSKYPCLTSQVCAPSYCGDCTCEMERQYSALRTSLEFAPGCGASELAI